MSKENGINPIDLYVSGLSINQVSKKLGWSYSKTQVFLQTAGVTRSSGEGVHLSKSLEPFSVSEPLIELVDGILLSDAFIEKAKWSGRLSIGQSGNHRPWIYDLYSQLASFGVKAHLDEEQGREVLIKGKICTRKDRITLRTASYPWFLEQWGRWYPNGKKVIPQDIRLTPVSIAGWLWGDGLCGQNGYRVEFCTDGFLRDNVIWLAEELKKKFSWSPLINKRGRIVLCQQFDRDSLLEMLTPLVPDCFLHKLQLNRRSSWLKLDEKKKEKMEELRGQGWSIDRLSKYFGMSRSGIYGAVSRLGLSGKRVKRSKEVERKLDGTYIDSSLSTEPNEQTRKRH